MLTGEYSTPEFRRRFAEQARGAAERAEAIIAVSEFTARPGGSICWASSASRIHVVHHGIRTAGMPAARESE